MDLVDLVSKNALGAAWRVASLSPRAISTFVFVFSTESFLSAGARGAGNGCLAVRRRSGTTSETERSFAVRDYESRKRVFRIYRTITATRAVVLCSAYSSNPSSPFRATPRRLSLYHFVPGARVRRYEGDTADARRYLAPRRVGGSLFHSCTPLCRFPFARLSR